MTELKKHALLLSLIALLCVLKFVIVPVIDWQNEQVINIQAKEKKLAKIESVLADSTEISTERQKLILMLDKADKLFFPTQTEAEFKLNQQQAFEKRLSAHSLSAINFSWETKTEFTALAMTRYQIKTRLDGQFVDIVSFFAELESVKPWLQVSDFNVSTSGNSDNNLGYVRGANLTLSLYMRQTPTNRLAN